MLLGALMVTAALLGTFSAGPGPLGKSGAGGEQCAPDQQGHWETMAAEIENNGSSPVVILSVRLPADARNMRMTDAWIVPIYHDPKTGNFMLAGGEGFPYPPTEQLSPTWDQRTPAAGAVIRPGTGPREAVTLVFAVTRTSAATAGRSGPPVIVYSAGGTTYTAQQGFSMVLADKCSPDGLT